MKARHQERALWLGLLMAALLLFDGLPRVDLWISSQFHAGAGAFPADRWPWVRAIYVAVPWLGRLAFAAALLVLWRAWRRPPQVGRRWWRRCAALVLTLLVGVGVIGHGVFKEQWGRPRPDGITAFDGPAPFVPALQMSDYCSSNCAFISGHAATGFALAAWGLFGSPATRRRWHLIGAASGLAIGLLRVAQGRHFASDVVFAWILVLAVMLALRWLWLLGLKRRRAPRPDVVDLSPPASASGSAR